MKTKRWDGIPFKKRSEDASDRARFRWFKTTPEDRIAHSKMMNLAKKKMKNG